MRGRLFSKPADLRRIRRRAYPVYRDFTPQLAVTLATIAFLFGAVLLLFAPF